MSEQLALANAALKAGQRDAAIGHLIAACTEAPAQHPSVYQALVTQLYLARRVADGLVWAERASEQGVASPDTLNIHGVMLRMLGRPGEALGVLDRAAGAAPGNFLVQLNRGNVLLELGRGAEAEAAFAFAAAQDAQNSDFRRQVGRAQLAQGKLADARDSFRQALALKPGNVDAWLDLITLEAGAERLTDALAAADEALGAAPGDERLSQTKAGLLQRIGDRAMTADYLLSLRPRFENTGWLQFQLALTISDYGQAECTQHLRRAVELSPGTPAYICALIESLSLTTLGDEGANLEEACQLARGLLEQKAALTPQQTRIIYQSLVGLCAFDETARLGTFRDLGRSWVEAGLHTALLKHLGAASSEADKAELMEQHRIWGRAEEQRAAAQPVHHPAPRPRDGRIRLGFLSSDLRRHPVGRFAHTLFERIDPRFDLYCYSFFRGGEDDQQAWFASRAKAFRSMPHASTRNAAQTIADDQLDILIELGGSTSMNRLEVMAYKPAPIQASWLGYPHSAGLSTIDYFLCDPHSAPADPTLLMEWQLVLPDTWVALSRESFSNALLINEDLPSDDNGYVTFGTANNPHKYTREVLRTWARVTASVPQARFAFIRPEGGSASFRRHVLAEFGAEGVEPGQVIFHTIRGAHMPFYNTLDITLDPFPLTGGTTTAEALWMGVPVVSLRGGRFHERLSSSLLANAGLSDLIADSLEDYLRIARDLAHDRARRLDLRQDLRTRLLAGPLGQTEAFAGNFYDTVARAVAAGPPAARA